MKKATHQWRAALNVLAHVENSKYDYLIYIN